MKKSLVAVGVIVALGAVWAGSSWYTGKQLEGRMAEMVQRANSELNDALPEAGLVISYENYQRGTLSSEMQIVFKNAENAKTPLLPEGESIVFNEKISHGPLPGLTHFSFIPAMASVQSELVKNTVTEPLFVITKDQSPINADTRIAFDGATSSVINLIPIDFTKDNSHVVFSGSTMDLDIDAKANKIKFALNANSGSVDSINDVGQTMKASFNGISLTSDSQISDIADLRIGTQKMGLQDFNLAVEGKEMAALKGFVISAVTELQADKKNVAMQADYSLDALKAQGQDFGSGKLAVKLNNLDAEALVAVSKAYTQESQKLLSDAAIMQDPDLYREKMVEAIAASLPQLLKGNPTLSVAPLSWKNSKGEATFNLSLALKDPQNAEITPADTAETVLGRYLTSLDTRLVIPMDMATQLVSQVSQLEGVSAKDAEQAAAEQVKGLAAMGQMFHITKVEDNNITATLIFADNKATLNGEAVPLSDFFGALPFGIGDTEEGEEPGMAEPESQQTEEGAEAPELLVPDVAEPEVEVAPQQ